VTPLLRIEDANRDNFRDIPIQCRHCLYWQSIGEFREDTSKPEAERQKQEWFAKVSKEFGNCIKIAYSSDSSIGIVIYAPLKYFPRTKEYAAGLPSEAAIFIACLYVADKEARRKGVGTKMLQNLTAELKSRGFGSIETFARRSDENNPSGPLSFYLKHGFKVKSEGNGFPLVHLDL
jgi:GNAT superfamily N-acetyltransferase